MPFLSESFSGKKPYFGLDPFGIESASSIPISGSGIAQFEVAKDAVQRSGQPFVCDSGF